MHSIMSVRSKEKEERAELRGILIAGIIAFLIGKLLGAASLVSQPVIMTNRAPDPDLLPPGEVVYIKGDRGSSNAWMLKEQALLSGKAGSIVLTEGDLNRWSKDRLTPKRKSPSDEDAAEGWMDRFIPDRTAPNFRIVDHRLQMATELRWPEFFGDRIFVCLIEGRLQQRRGKVVFIPETGTLGKAPFGSLPVYDSLLTKLVFGPLLKDPDLSALVESWPNVESAKLTTGQLQLAVEAPGQS
jgi:hypothetical protein